MVRTISVGFLLLLLGLSSWWMLTRPDPRLNWTPEYILSSPAKTARYVEARLQVFLDKLTYQQRQLLSRNLEQLINREIPASVATIDEGKKAAQTGPALTITLLPDEHISVDGASAHGKQIQQKIRAYFKDKPASTMVLMEGFEGPVTWQTFYQGMQASANLVGRTLPFADILSFMDWAKMTASPDAWWITELDSSRLRLIGVDQQGLVEQTLIVFFSGPDIPDPLPAKEPFGSTKDWLNLGLRDQAILARCVLAMRKNNVQQAYLTLGAMHAHTLPNFAELWGVKMTVYEWPK